MKEKGFYPKPNENAEPATDMPKIPESLRPSVKFLNNPQPEKMPKSSFLGQALAKHIQDGQPAKKDEPVSILKKKKADQDQGILGKKIPKKKPRKVGCLGQLFFCQFNSLFDKVVEIDGHLESKLKKQDMFPLPEATKAENILDRVKKIEASLEPTQAFLVTEKKKLAPMTVGGKGNTYTGRKKDKGVLSKVGEGVKNLGKNFKANLMLNVGNNSRTIQNIVFKMIKPKILTAIFIKSLERIVFIGLSLIPLNFLPQLKKSDDDKNFNILYSYPILAIFLSFLLYFMREHSAKFICQSGSAAG